MQYLFGNPLAFVVTLLVAALIAGILRGVLDRQPARWRAFIVALLAIIVVAETATPIAKTMGLTESGSFETPTATLWWLAVMAFVVLTVGVAALGLLVLGEAISPSGRFGTPLDIVRDTKNRIRRSARYADLGRIALTSGLWGAAPQGPDSPKFADATVKTLSKAGPTFVKIGQVLSTRSEIVSPTLATALTRLQADADAIHFATIEAELTKAWATSPQTKLQHLDPQPLAAASLAQVHTATTPAGDEVVVKVRRPGSVPQVTVDTEILKRFATNADRRFTWARQIGIVDLADGLSASLLEELDYRKEARNMRASAASTANQPDIVIPHIYDELCTDNVLVMQRLRGRKATEAASTLSPERRRELCTALLSYLAYGIFDSGIFHADLHPGNILLLDDGRLGLLDFGAIGVIDTETRRHLATLLLAILTGDNLAATTALTLAFDIDPDTNRAAMQRDLGRLMTLHLSGTPAIDSLITDLFTFLQRHGVSIPGDVAGAFRTIASAQATLEALDPNVNYLELLREILPGILKALADPQTVAAQAAVESALAVSIARQLPERIDRITRDMVDGRFVVHTRAFADESDRRWASSVVTDALSGVLAAALIAVGAWLLTQPAGAELAPGIGIFTIIGAVTGVTGAALAFRTLVRAFRNPRRGRE